jgi:hypothetical protein
MAHGRVLMESGRVTIVDEARVRERFAEAVAQRVYRPTARVRRWAEDRACLVRVARCRYSMTW